MVVVEQLLAGRGLALRSGKPSAIVQLRAERRRRRQRRTLRATLDRDEGRPDDGVSRGLPGRLRDGGVDEMERLQRHVWPQQGSHTHT